MWKKYNPNPTGARVGDCVIRAISKATDSQWNDVYMGVCLQGLKMSDMPSANHVWGAYLKEKGFTRNVLPNTCPDCYTVKDFCQEHKSGIFILAVSGHVVCVKDGDYYDSWDSGDEVPMYYWEGVV